MAIKLKKLTAAEQSAMEKLAHSRTAPARVVERARVILLAASASSSLNFGVEPLQFHAGILDAELPINAALFRICFVGPHCDVALQFGQCADARGLCSNGTETWDVSLASL